MKVIYLIKKGLQVYPPCLTQILTLNDLGVQLRVYHGRNNKYIDDELNKRGIEHYTLTRDKDNKGKLERITNFLEVKKEINEIIKKNFTTELFIWFGNCETAIAVKPGNLADCRYAINVLELYEERTFIEIELKRIIKGAEFLVSCEPHRSEILRVRYNLEFTPFTIPNKPYEFTFTSDLSETVRNAVERVYGIQGTKIIYQGIIQKNRPVDQVSKALSSIKDPNLYYIILGRCTEDYKRYLLGIYENTVFLDYIPAPEHLLITKLCDIGIANYDFSILNTIFCAPNKIFEYTRYGIPVLATDNISLRETIGRCQAGRCANFSDVKSIRNGIEEIMHNYDFYKEKAYEFYNSVDIKELLLEIVKKHKLIYKSKK